MGIILGIENGHNHWGAVPKRLKGMVCKTIIRGFESLPRLHSLSIVIANPSGIDALGKDYETFIQVDDFTDEQMVQKLGIENSTSEGAPWNEQVDMVVVARFQ